MAVLNASGQPRDNNMNAEVTPISHVLPGTPLFVLLYRPTFAELYRVPSYGKRERKATRLYQGLYSQMEGMCWGIEAAGGEVRYAFFNASRGDAAKQPWIRAELILYRESTEEPHPFSTIRRRQNLLASQAKKKRRKK